MNRKNDIVWILLGTAALAGVITGIYIDVKGFQEFGWLWLLR